MVLGLVFILRYLCVQKTTRCVVHAVNREVARIGCGHGYGRALDEVRLRARAGVSRLRWRNAIHRDGDGDFGRVEKRRRILDLREYVGTWVGCVGPDLLQILRSGALAAAMRAWHS